MAGPLSIRPPYTYIHKQVVFPIFIDWKSMLVGYFLHVKNPDIYFNCQPVCNSLSSTSLAESHFCHVSKQKLNKRKRQLDKK